MLLDLGSQTYVNEKQFSMIEQKITKRNLEIANHKEHFDFIHGHP